MCDESKDSEIEELVSKLQEKVKDIWRPYFSNRTYMAKWLQARDFDLKKAEAMLRSHILWRENENIETILDDFKIPEVYEKYGFGGYCGHDKEGRPVSYEIFGRCDPQGLMKCMPTSEILRTRNYLIELLFKQIFPQRSAEEGHEVAQIVAVFELDGFSRKHLWRPSMECMIEALKTMEANYPEFMHKILILNAPPLFKIAFNIIKPFLHQATRNKINFLGKGFKDELLQIIDADQLPAYFGGNMYGPDEDPMCRHLIRWGGEVPSCYYFSKHSQEMVTVNISPRSKVKLSYYINQEESVLHYEFSTKDHDINFGIFYIGEEMKGEIDKIKSSHLEKILNLHRTHANITIQKGEIGSLRVGYYLLEFDNSYSWINSKKVQYHIEVLDIMK